MECQACHTANPDSSRYCESCGSALSYLCASCGFVCTPQARFCGGCGMSLGRGATSPLAARRPADFLSTAPGWGELKQATVLFADIVGSTEHIAELDAEQAMGRMRPAILRMCESVERFGGTVVRTLGDGVMALFGAPHALEGHARLACEAALHMQETFAREVHGLTIRVGLHSGQVASDPQDALTGKGGGAHGVTIHVASRVVGLAQPGGICLTQACRALVGHACQAVAMGTHALKGIGGQVEVHALTGLASGVHPLYPLGMAPTPFRGRQRELAQLHEAARASAAGAPKVVGIVGEPGAGKSRLCQEFVQVCRQRGTAVHEVRAQLYGHAMPLQPVLELFRTHFFGIGAGDDAAAARQRIADATVRLALTDVDRMLLYEFFGVPQPGAAALAIGPKARQSRLLALLRDLIRLDAGADRVILIEDLHWLDEASEEFVSALVEAVIGTHTLLLLNYRPSYRPPWILAPHFEQMELRELAPADMDALVAELLRPLTSLPDIRQMVVRRSGGNPFFAEELVRALAETGVLSAETGLPPGGLEAVERALPATVQAVIGARLDRLGEPEKTLLQMCAIIGKEIPLAVLEQVAAPLAGQIERGLDGLCSAGLILPQPAQGGRRFAFRHPLIQEVAYNTQLKVRRGAVHSAVAATMTVYYSEQLDEFAALVAYHYEEAGQPVASARYNARAANWVGSTNASQSIKHWRKVWSLLAREGGAEADGLRVMAGGKIAWLGWREGLTLAEVRPFLDESLAQSAHTDPRLTRMLLMAEGRILQATGESADLYVGRVERALAFAHNAGDQPRSVVLHAALSQAYGWAGLLRKALDANDLALAHIADVDPFDEAFVGFSIEQWVLAMRGRLLTRLGLFDQARRCLDQLTEIGARSIDPVLVQMPHYAYLELAAQLRDIELATGQLDRVARIAQKHDNPYLRVFALNGGALIKQLRQDHAGAAGDLGEALALVRNASVAIEFETEILASLAESHRQAGNLELSLAVSKETVRLSKKRANRLPQCRAMITWRHVLLADPRMGAAGEPAALLAEVESLIDTTGALGYRLALHPQAAATVSE